MFNEEENIDNAIGTAVEALTKYTDDYEIVIVDDASTDSSPMLVARQAADNPRIGVIRHEKNRQLGGALKSGFGAAKKDLVLYMDADLPFDPDVLGRAIRELTPWIESEAWFPRSSERRRPAAAEPIHGRRASPCNVLGRGDARPSR